MYPLGGGPPADVVDELEALAGVGHLALGVELLPEPVRLFHRPPPVRVYHLLYCAAFGSFACGGVISA